MGVLLDMGNRHGALNREYGNAFTVTSIATGSSSNYPITLSNSADYSVSGAASLVGGRSAGTVYDSGTITATIANIPATVSWGQSDTAASVATNLKSAINNSSAGSLVTATLDTNNANYIDLSSKTAGASTNYSVSVTANDALATQYPNLLTNPSFSAVGDNMAGGAGAVSSYGTIYSYAAAYAQNGNILAHADSVMGTWNFTYDGVDRLMTAQQTAYTATSQKYAGNYGCWNWTYDSFGNRTLEAYSATASCGSNLTPEIGASYNQANNQIQSVWGTTAATFVYDASGNTQNDGVNKYWYDAEGQLCAVERTIGGPITQYIYDAEGARIGKGTLSTAPATGATCAPPLSSGFTISTRWLVGLGGDQVTELNSAGNWAHSNIFAAGKLTATYDTNGIHFELSDPLGTKRVQANASGQVDEYCTSLPFGNDLTNPLGASCTGSEDATEHHFTQKERDTESGNDYFFARYYTSALGRFTTPDWSAKTDPVPYAVFDDPQSLNLYAYVRNNPIVHFDENGHCDWRDLRCLQNEAWDKAHGAAEAAQDAYNKARKAEKTAEEKAEKALDIFNGTLGFGSTNCAGGGNCDDAAAQALGAVVVGVLSDGESEGGFIEKTIGTTETKIENIIKNDLSGETLSAAEREANGGMKVAGPDGKLYSHEDKVGRGIRGLSRQIEHLERMLKRSDLSESQTGRMNGLLEKARGMMRVAAQAIDPKSN